MNSSEKAKQRRWEEVLSQWHNRAPICRTFGMSLDYDEHGNARIELPHNPRIDHGMGGIHGGVIATLLDNAGWFTVATRFDHWIATLEFHVRLLDHAEKCDLVASGSIVRLGKTISTAEMKVCRKDGKAIAVGSGSFVLTGVERPQEQDAIHAILKKYEGLFPGS